MLRMSTPQGYFLASYLYMSITFVLPLSAGVIALALDLPVSVDEAFEGLVLPASAYVVMGKSGGLDEAPFLHSFVRACMVLRFAAALSWATLKVR